MRNLASFHHSDAIPKGPIPMMIFRRIIFIVLLTSITSFSPSKIWDLFLRPPSKNSWLYQQGQKMDIDPNKSVNFMNFVKKYPGYIAETYKITTDDGYILTLHRISGSPTSPKAFGKPVIFLQHGLLCASDIFIVMGRENSIAFDLADSGYDVWLGNARGNTYSRLHRWLDPIDDKEEFWKFSIHEHAMYDLRKSIDTVLSMTKQLNLIYIGHSMGTTMGFILLSQKPEYNGKIGLFINLSPIVHFNFNESPFIKFFREATNPIKYVTYKTKMNEIFAHNKFTTLQAKYLCPRHREFYKEVFTPLVDPSHLPDDKVCQILECFPAGTSRDVLEHFGQLIRPNGTFMGFDQGIQYNFGRYHTKTPPTYNLSKVTTKVAIFYGIDDSLADVFDVLRLKAELSQVIYFREMPHPKFNHLDFLLSDFLKPMVNQHLLQLIQNFLLYGPNMDSNIFIG